MGQGAIFHLLYRLFDGSTLHVAAIHTGEFDNRGTAKVTIRAVHTGFPPVDVQDQRKRSVLLWEPGQTWCHPSPFWTLDSPEMRKLVTSLVSIKPGDTDEDYFADYTPEQLAFCERYGEELDCMAGDRYGWDS